MYHDALRRLQGIRKEIAEGDDSEEAKNAYISALTNILDRQKSASTRSGLRYKTPDYRPDGILDGADVARLLSPYRNFENSEENKQRPARSLDGVIASLEQKIQFEVPELDENVVSNLPGGWKVSKKESFIAGIKTDSNRAVDRIVNRFGSTRDAMTSAEDVEAYKKYNYAKALAAKAAAGNKATFRDIVDNRGNTIRVFRNPRSSNNTNLAATDKDIRVAAESFNLIRDRMGSDKKPVRFSFIAPSSILPDGRQGKPGSGRTLGYAYLGGEAHGFADRFRDNSDLQSEWNKPYDPNTSWHSVETSSEEENLRHTVIHEYAHVIMYKYWATDSLSFTPGKEELAKDYKKFGVQIKSGSTKVSRYGSKNVAEHFAEAYARYVITGQASPEFLQVLRSKGLLKSQQEG